jgi:peptidoglycan/xylan/chitin deacetylase (PgdA/CDA1 family)
VSSGFADRSAAARGHLERTVRTCLGLRADAPVDVPELPNRLARLLLRDEERERPDQRDRWGRWEFEFSENFRAGRLWVPEVDEWLSAQRAELAKRVELEPLWPEGRRFAVCLTHDVDMVSRQATPRQIARAVRLGLSARGYRSHHERAWAARALARAARFGLARVPSCGETLERCLAIEQHAGVVASYFFTVYPPARPSPYDCVYRFSDDCEFLGRRRPVRDVIRAIADDGFDVGLHGGYHTAGDASALTAEKDMLEIAAGREITTTRQHYLHWDVRRTPLLHERAGLRADSTLGFNRNVGFRAGTSLPFRLCDIEALLTLDVAEAGALVERMLETVANVEGVATILVHPHVLMRKDVADLYRRAIQQAIGAGAWVTSLQEIDHWWRNREQRLENRRTAPPA